MLKFLPVVLLVIMCFSLPTAFAKNLKGKCTVEDGKAANLDALKAEVETISFDVNRYEQIIDDPTQVKNDKEALAVLQAREIFILVDKSGSMLTSDDDPRSDHMQIGKMSGGSTNWTRWDSARIAAEGLAEVALTLDRDGTVPVYFFSGRGLPGTVELPKVEAVTINEITAAFATQTPKGTTPLADALNKLYNEHLRSLLDKGESFTVIVLTDGAPDEKGKVIDFFDHIVRDHRLTDDKRKHLAAFTFVQMGDDKGADQFLAFLDDKLSPVLGVDIIDTKKDNFIFGTDPRFAKDCGPLAILRDAVFD